jgi:transcriptional regulator with XRE-family HTH domain
MVNSMSTDSFDGLWQRFAKSKRYRTQFVSAQARRAFAFQLRAIMKKRGISQEKLAERAGLTQGVISRASDPNYGKLTITVITKIANGLDMAYLGILVPYSKAVEWVSNLSEDFVQVRDFEEENAGFSVKLGAFSMQANDNSSHGKTEAHDAEEEAMGQRQTGRSRFLEPVPLGQVMQPWSF